MEFPCLNRISAGILRKGQIFPFVGRVLSVETEIASLLEGISVDCVNENSPVDSARKVVSN